MHEQSGCAHFSAFVGSISFYPTTSDQDRINPSPNTNPQGKAILYRNEHICDIARDRRNVDGNVFGFRNKCCRFSAGSGALDFFYLASFDGKELRVPGAAAILGFAIIEDEGFVAFLKHLLNAIRWGLLAIGPAPFEIGFTVNAIAYGLVNTKSLVNRDSTALRSLFS